MGNRLTRRSFVVGLGALGAVAVAACSSGANAPSSPAASAPSQPTTSGAAASATTAPAAQAASSAPKVQLNWWTHGAEEVNKKKMLGILVDNYHQKHPETTVTITWTQMPGIWQQLQAAFTADSGYPDIFWFASDHQQWAVAGWVADLTDGINWKNMEDWAKTAGMLPGPDGKEHVYFLTEYATTLEMYYNQKMFKDFGITVPDNGQFDQDAFEGVVKTVTGKGMAAFANANGDRNYPGEEFPMMLFLNKFGQDDLIKLWKGEIPWTDPRAVAVLEYYEQLVKLKAYPATFSSMTLSESHHYFHTEHKAAMFPIPSWYTARAFVPIDKGGQPADFELGFLEYPLMKDAKGAKAKYLDPGGAQTAAQKSKNRDKAIDVLNGYTDIDWATQWVGVTSNPTAVKIDPSKIKSDHPDYWTKYFKAQAGMTMCSNTQVGTVAKPAQNDVFINVVSTGMSGGLLTAKQAVEQLDAGWKKGAG